MSPHSLGTSIQQKRLSLGLTQQQLADMAGLSRQSIAQRYRARDRERHSGKPRGG